MQPAAVNNQQAGRAVEGRRGTGVRVWPLGGRNPQGGGSPLYLLLLLHTLGFADFVVFVAI